MHSLTKLCLKKPVSTVIIIIALVIFGFSSVTGMNMQLTPDMEFPAIIAIARYPQAGPEEVDRLVAQKLEKVGATIKGLDSIQTRSFENYCYGIYMFDYGIDTDNAYMDLQEEIARLDLPDDVDTPTLVIMDINAAASITVSVTSKSGAEVLNFVNDTFEPEISKVSNVASTSVAGGQEEYIRVELMPEKLTQYKLSLPVLANYVGASDFTMPAGNVEMGGQEYKASAQLEYNRIRDIENIPVTTGTGQIIHLSDVANVYLAKRDAVSLSRYNGNDDVQLSITKQQGSNAVKLSGDVKKVVDKMRDMYPDMNFTIMYDSADTIISSLRAVAETLVLGIVLSMIVLFIFFGDLKASLIVGSSMPVSLLVTAWLMGMMGFSLNMVTMGALVIGIGMMVDNSIVVLEMCFQKKEQGFSFEEAAYDAVKTVALSVTASTITTVVVYLPLALLKGLSGQMFGQLGFTIIFALVASLIASITLVPLCFAKYKPIEKKKFIVNRIVRRVAGVYGGILTRVLRHRILSAFIGIALMVGSLFCTPFIHAELSPETDAGNVSIAVDIRPGLSLEKRDKLLNQLESFVSSDDDVENYQVSTSSGESTMSVTAYLKSDRSRKTKVVASDWNKQLAGMKDCKIVCSSAAAASIGGRSSSMGSSSDSEEIDIKGADFNKLKAAANALADDVRSVKGVTSTSSSFSNSSSKAEIVIDPIKASAAGVLPQTAAQSIYMIKNGNEPLEISIDDKDYKVKLEYPDELYDTVPKMLNMTFTGTGGKIVYLSDIAEIKYTDTPQTITRKDGFYTASVTCILDSEHIYEAKEAIADFMDEYELPRGITNTENSRAEMMREEFTSIGGAILSALWLVFMVMTMQFESARFSGMIMLCIPFSLIGSFLLLIITQATLSMNSMMGFLMLEGIVVNNGILMVDTTNQYRQTMSVDLALVEAGKSRLRPILMTTLTTILSMVPLALGVGENGQVMQGMAVVIVGGLIASTLLSLLLLPTFYMIIYKRSKTEKSNKKRNKRGLFRRKNKKDPEFYADDDVELKDEGVDN